MWDKIYEANNKDNITWMAKEQRPRENKVWNCDDK